MTPPDIAAVVFTATIVAPLSVALWAVAIGFFRETWRDR